jgi:hypothetical protein
VTKLNARTIVMVKETDLNKQRLKILMCSAMMHALMQIQMEEIKGVKALTCPLFTIERYLANGSHVKFKSRLVAHGNEQDRLMYPYCSSPTVTLQAMMACLTAVANHKILYWQKMPRKPLFKLKGKALPCTYVVIKPLLS